MRAAWAESFLAGGLVGAWRLDALVARIQSGSTAERADRRAVRTAGSVRRPLWGTPSTVERSGVELGRASSQRGGKAARAGLRGAMASQSAGTDGQDNSRPLLSPDGKP